MWIVAAGRVMLGLSAACLLGGCTGVPTLPAAQMARASSERCVADWDDVDAAIDVGASKSEMAVVSWGMNADGERAYKLRTALDEPVWVCAKRVGDPKKEESALLELRARVGRFGDADREERLLRAVRKRLDELCGVATSPLD